MFNNIYYNFHTSGRTKKVGYITSSFSDDPSLEVYMERAKEICRKWSVPFLNMYKAEGACINMYAVQQKYINSASGMPNKKAYEEIFTPKIETWIKNELISTGYYKREENNAKSVLIRNVIAEELTEYNMWSEHVAYPEGYNINNCIVYGQYKWSGGDEEIWNTGTKFGSDSFSIRQKQNNVDVTFTSLPDVSGMVDFRITFIKIVE